MEEKGRGAHCVYCGATEELVPDEHLQELWYCSACLARRDAHQELIDHGLDDEDPTYE
ncbi:MAG: hypothetical protein R3C71_02570 [Candidatus Krumholzibacteriia bacterium]|nr:hypothetical protein [bacterium]MCB9513751.1 hypothetical protein [Candidatus Latescibacterota bacterium]MCB9515372.1 hypothetical protein [Candidatus Latescibacterota bacterium]